jgi:hypothetical protein
MYLYPTLQQSGGESPLTQYWDEKGQKNYAT